MPVARRILALDLASRIGWCRGTIGTRPEFGAHQLPSTGDDIGAYIEAFETFIDDMRIGTGPPHEFAVFECPVLPPKTSFLTLRKLYALPAFLEYKWRKAMLPADRLREMHPGSIKKFWTGKGNAKKPEMIAAAVARGYDLSLRQDDEADAIATWHFAAACLNGDGVEHDQR